MNSVTHNKWNTANPTNKTNDKDHVEGPPPATVRVLNRPARRGTNGVGANGVTASFMIFDRGTFWVLALTYFIPPQKCQVCLPSSYVYVYSTCMPTHVSCTIYSHFHAPYICMDVSSIRFHIFCIHNTLNVCTCLSYVCVSICVYR